LVGLNLFFATHLSLSCPFFIHSIHFKLASTIGFQRFLKCEKPICSLVTYHAPFKFHNYSKLVIKNTFTLLKLVLA
jgi:hypothetical protein